MPNDEEDMWAVYAKTVKPLGTVKKKRTSAKTTPQVGTIRNAPSGSRKTLKAGRMASSPAILFDRRAERRLRQGDIDIDARIDLHGMRQDEAHDALIDFVSRNIKAGKRTLLVITGKGRNGLGILRASIRNWLAASHYARHIMAFRSASIKHGGGGAFYVLLRRQK